MSLQIQPGVIGDKMVLVYHSAAIKFPNNEVQLKAAHIDAVKAGHRDLITIYVEVPGQREDVAGLESKMLEHVAYLLHPYTFEVYQASGKEWAEYVGDVEHLFPKAAKELEMAVRVRNENIQNGGIHVYPEKPNCPGPRGQQYVLLNPGARFVRAELGKPSDEPLVLMFINVATGQCVPEFYRASGTLDFHNPADIRDINKWRCQVMSRKKCEPLRFDKAVDDMWTVKEQGRLNQLVRAVLEHHRRFGKDEDVIFDSIDWDMVRMELESFCYDPQPSSSELAICCDADFPAEGKAQRRHLGSERVTFCRTSELVKQRAIDTIVTIMESEIDAAFLEKSEKCGVFNLVKLDDDDSDEEEEDDDEGDVGEEVAASHIKKKVAAPVITNKVVSGRIIKAQTNGKKGRGKRAPKANGTGGANSKKKKALAATPAESSSCSASQSAADDVATPAAVKTAKGKGKKNGKGKEVVADADVMITNKPATHNNHDAMDVGNDLVSAIALSKLSSGAADGAGPPGDPCTPPAKPAGGLRRSARRQK